MPDQSATTPITEQISRSALLHAATNYESISEALLELIDNPIDYRGRGVLQIDVWIEKERDEIIILDRGGAGMSDGNLREWIRWGEGEEHAASDIGQFRVGGKLAAIYLAKDLEILARQAGSSAIWLFHDPDWGVRTARMESSVRRVHHADIEWRHRAIPGDDEGFVRITLRGLTAHRYDLEVLESTIQDTYRQLISSREVQIRLNGAEVGALEMPWSDDLDPISFEHDDLATGDISIRGTVGAIDRDLLPRKRGSKAPAGVRTYFNGRRITQGEQFGHNLGGRGTLQRLYGELYIEGTGLLPNQLKNGWAKDSDGWRTVHQILHDHMLPVIQRLNALARERPVDDRVVERARRGLQRAERARSRLEAKIKRGRGRSPEAHAAARHFLDQASDSFEIEIRPLGAGPQTSWDESSDGTPIIVVNADHPQHEVLSQHVDYFFEMMLWHFLADAGEIGHVAVSDLVDELIWIEQD